MWISLFNVTLNIRSMRKRKAYGSGPAQRHASRFVTPMPRAEHLIARAGQCHTVHCANGRAQYSLQQRTSVWAQDALGFPPTPTHCFPHSSGVPGVSSNSVTSFGDVSSGMAPTMSGDSVVRLTMRLT
jgi:hypothetical protein